jgi:rhamnosyl/mannosyltransferase
MDAFYGAASVFALPSTARSEAFGIVQIEALASGVPVVNTALTSGVPFVSIHEETGLTVEPNDPGQLARAVNRILDDESFASRLGSAARERALALFTSDRMVEETWHLYRSLRGAGASDVRSILPAG